MDAKIATKYIDAFITTLLGVLLVGFPLVFFPGTTDIFIIPKQLFLATVVLVGLLAWGVKMVLEKTVRIKQTPFTLPVLLLLVFAFASSILSVNRYDSLLAFVPLFFGIAAYFIIVNIVRSPMAFLTMISAWIGSATLLALFAVLSYSKVYVLPFDFTKVQNFTPAGSYLDLAILLVMTLPIAFYFVYPLVRLKSRVDFTPSSFLFAISSVIITVGLGVTLYGLATQFTPRVLPLETGFQTAFAAISQDSGRTLQSFLVGGGYGTYSAEFSRFKQPAFNLNTDIWNLQFIRSSSFALELLGTTGVLGFGAFVFLLVVFIRHTSGEKKHNPLYVSLFLGFVLSFVLPLSPVAIVVFFFILGLFASTQPYPDVKWHFTTLTEGILSGSSLFGASSATERKSPVFAVLVLVLFIGIAGYIAYYEYKFMVSDITFQKSLVSLTQNKASDAYDLQNKSITTFPYRDFYHRSFSQLNLALANSLASNQPKGASPSAQVQQTLYTLIQQSIAYGRSAVAVSPQTAINWQNLSSIYRSLIGFGQNAEQFAVLAQQQAIALDPSNPQQYIVLGGLYYQLQQWDSALRQFQIAANIKPDFANAYYNAGHALESKGDLQNALAYYEAVRRLVAADKDNLSKIDKEIEVIKQKVGEQAAKNAASQAPAQAANQRPAQNQPNLEVNKPATQLPEQEEKVSLPAPTESTQSAR